MPPKKTQAHPSIAQAAQKLNCDCEVLRRDVLDHWQLNYTRAEFMALTDVQLENIAEGFLDAKGAQIWDGVAITEPVLPKDRDYISANIVDVLRRQRLSQHIIYRRKTKVVEEDQDERFDDDDQFVQSSSSDARIILSQETDGLMETSDRPLTNDRVRSGWIAINQQGIERLRNPDTSLMTTLTSKDAIPGGASQAEKWCSQYSDLFALPHTAPESSRGEHGAVMNMADMDLDTIDQDIGISTIMVNDEKCRVDLKRVPELVDMALDILKFAELCLGALERMAERDAGKKIPDFRSRILKETKKDLYELIGLESP